VLEEIGHGGMGTVYLAEPKEPVRRRVALKVIKLGMDTKAVLARFEAERQALAMMDHPSIAKVLEACCSTARCEAKRARDGLLAAHRVHGGSSMSKPSTP
jgi:serine/threonine protein kinase